MSILIVGATGSVGGEITRRLAARGLRVAGLVCEGEISVDFTCVSLDPEESTSQAELTRLLEQSLMSSPDQYRTVLMLRDVEELSTSETAAALGLTEDNLKVRLHRGRSLLRRELLERVGTSTRDTFPFMGHRCDRVVKCVFDRLPAAPFTSSGDDNRELGS